MPARTLVLSKNDQHHPLEELGERLMDWLADSDVVETEHTHDSDALADLTMYDLCVICATMNELTPEQEASVLRFVRDGGKLVGIHSVTVIDAERTAFIDLIGGRFTHHSPYHEFPVKVVESGHPIMAGVADFSILDELYVLDRAPAGAHVLATAEWDGASQPLIYTKDVGAGTVLYNALGHDQAAYDHADFRTLVLQGIDWILDA
ncbi:hypothetical protein CMK11_17895 [Candidatus Poribacteria bacterium]|nr:hypothetical protein [Candidatus Poribacteria bacterium]